MNWTVFGAGNFISDILDAIEARGDSLTHLYYNQKLSPAILAKIPSSVSVAPIADFVPTTDHYFFGFIDPAKQNLLDALTPHHLTFANLIHPRAYISREVTLGEGNYFGAGAIVGPGSTVGNYNFINRSASLGHDLVVGSGNHFGPSSTISGRCLIGNGNMFGTGSTVIDGLKINDQILLGAGAVLLRDALQPGTYVGVPAKMITRS